MVVDSFLTHIVIVIVVEVDLNWKGRQTGREMASATATTSSLSSSSAFINAAKAPPQLLPPPLPLHSTTSHLAKSTLYCRKIVRNVVSMATSTGEAPVAAEVVATTETPEILKTIQEAWDKVEDKYAVTSLVVAGTVALWASAGMISAIDKLPLIPGVLELVGIGYTGWFAYTNLVFKPDREAVIQKIKDTYSDIVGTGSS
ncbi:hypothetical protein ACS0TY_019530 [Phlomoides rotata]